MSSSQTRPASQSAPGLLKPWALLERLRPIKVAALSRQLLGYHRLCQGFLLIQKYFPAELKVYDPLSGAGWWQVLACLANLVERAEWFEINWPVLNEAWAYWMEDPEEGGDHLAVFLQYIPVTLYGFTDGETIFEFSPMELLHALLAECEVPTISAQLLIDVEIYDEFDEVWGEQERERAWALLAEIETDPGQYPESVRWLPELARWACHRTGNVILDNNFDPYRAGPWYAWDQVEEVKHAWQRAQPVIKAFHRLMTWIEADGSNITKLANFIMAGGNTDELDW